MISSRDAAYHPTDRAFAECAALIRRADIGPILDAARRQARGPGGRPPQCRYTLDAVLTVALWITHAGRVPSMAEVHRVLRILRPDQLARVGMAGQSPAAQDPGPGYAAFMAWLHRQLALIDPGADLPARRISNREHRRMLAARTREQCEASQRASGALHRIINRLVAASIDDADPDDYHGDVVADETIIDLAGPSAGLGSRDDKARGAAYMGAYYARDERGVPQSAGMPPRIRKAAFGIGVTAVTRVGPPGAVEAVPPVITGIAIHAPTSGSVEGLCAALDAHVEGGFGGRRGPRARWPYLVVDMGYNAKAAFAREMLDRGIAPVVRYPRHWTTVYATHAREGVAPGPVQIAGAFYCPAAAPIVEGRQVVRRTTEMLETDGFRDHDQLLRRLLPLLMGTNGRPAVGRTTAGRPAAKTDTPLPVRQVLVCPAVQGRVRCPMKPESMVAARATAPEVTPPPGAARFQCCTKTQVTVAYSDDQLRMMQPGLVPGSWEHTLYYEAARSLTEQRFSIMKSHHCTGASDLTWAPRREPMIALIVALQVVEANRVIQHRWHSRPAGYTGSTVQRMIQLRADLGHEPMVTPPRT